MPKSRGISKRAQIETYMKFHSGSYTVKEVVEQFETSYPNAKAALDEIVLNHSWAIVIKEGARRIYTFNYKPKD